MLTQQMFPMLMQQIFSESGIKPSRRFFATVAERDIWQMYSYRWWVRLLSGLILMIPGWLAIEASCDSLAGVADDLP
jgi:hypothetical protein